MEGGSEKSGSNQPLSNQKGKSSFDFLFSEGGVKVVLSEVVEY